MRQGPLLCYLQSAHLQRRGSRFSHYFYRLRLIEVPLRGRSISLYRKCRFWASAGTPSLRQKRKASTHSTAAIIAHLGHC